MTTPTAMRRRRVALQGFSDFERQTLASCFRLSAGRDTAYELVAHPGEADLLVADADQPQVVRRLAAAERLQDTVFIGLHAPAGAGASLPRPIEPGQLLRLLDGMTTLTGGSAVTAAPAAAPPMPAHAAGDAPTGEGRPGGASARPTAQAQPAQPAEAGESGESGESGDDGRAPLLIVDDSEIALRFLELELHALGLRCEQASDSAHALAMIERHPYQALVLDVELGEGSELDGLTLCQQVKRAHRRQGRSAPAVVMLSAHAAPLDRVRGTFAGADAYLGKPLDRTQLRHTLVSLGLLAA